LGVEATYLALATANRVVAPVFEAGLTKAQQRVGVLAQRLARGNTRRPRTAVEAEISAICKPRWVAEVMTVTLTGDKPTDLRLSFAVDTAARRALESRLFGKRILFTNRDTWPAAEIVAAYRSQAEAESGFRQLKDPHVVSFSPMHHWTESKIRVHMFYCVLALRANPLTAQPAGTTPPTPCKDDQMQLVPHSPTEGVYPATDDYVHAMEVRGAQRLLFVAGTMGLDPSGTPGTTLAEQLDLIWSNIRAILAAAGMTVDNIVRLTSYLRDASYAEANAVARVAALGGRTVPTTAIIAETLVSDWLIEIEVIAAG
jgi:enamine deaminase RidA (YjgF/YER057c/UK114 family)